MVRPSKLYVVFPVAVHVAPLTFQCPDYFDHWETAKILGGTGGSRSGLSARGHLSGREQVMMPPTPDRVWSYPNCTHPHAHARLATQAEGS